MNFYIPIEIKKRDYLSRLIIAKIASEKGYNVYIGSKNQVDRFVKSSKPGIYLGLVTTITYSKFYSFLRKRNFKIFVIDEEGLITFDDKMYLDLKVSKETLDSVEKLFTWGEEHKKIISKQLPKFKEKIVSTGTPRFDLFKPKFRDIFKKNVKNIKKNFGEFTLICGSFSFVNHFTKDLNYLNVLKSQNVIKNIEDEQRFIKYCKYNKESFENFIILTKTLSKKFINHNFVYRPHPAENIEVYREKFKNQKNIFIKNDYTLIEWIIASKCIIHSYCTSSIEALLVDKARFALKENFNEEVHKTIPYEFSETSKSIKELVDKFSIFYEKNFEFNLSKELNLDKLKEYISIDQNVLSSETIINEINEICPVNRLNNNSSLDYQKFKILNVIRYLKSLIYNFNKNYMKHKKYLDHKIKHIYFDEIKNDLNYLSDGKKSINVKRIDTNLFLLEKKI